MDDFTDYHRYAWSVVKPPRRPLIILLSRLPWYLAIAAIIYFFYTTRFFKEMDSGARILVFCLVTIITFGLIMIFDRIINRIEASRGPKLIHYQINRQGIFIDKKQYPHGDSPILHYPDEITKQKAADTLTYYRQTQHKS